MLNTNQTPVAGDYEIGRLWQTVNEVSAVTITPKTGKSSGGRTVYYEGTSGTAYAKSQITPSPSVAGSYAYLVTFDVAAVSGWNEAKGLSAGTLMVNNNKTPKAGDYDISGLAQPYGSVNPVKITPKSGSGNVTAIYYEGTSGMTYVKSATLPREAGSYIVTFDVAAATGWNEAKGLPAGTLTIAIQALSVTITGGPNVGKRWTADVQKNYSGEVAYQWLCEERIIGTGWYYTPYPADTGKKISVKVTCGGKTAPSQPVTVQMGAIEEVFIYKNGNFISGYLQIGDDYYSLQGEGWTIQWLRNGNVIPGETGYSYSIVQAVDADKTISAKVTGYGQSATSNGILIASTPPPPPPSSIDITGTWIATEEGVLESTEYSIAYTLEFYTDSSWKMDMEIFVDGELYDEESVEGTYLVIGKDVTLTTEDERVIPGTIGDDERTIVLEGQSAEGNDLTLHKDD